MSLTDGKVAAFASLLRIVPTSVISWVLLGLLSTVAGVAMADRARIKGQAEQAIAQVSEVKGALRLATAVDNQRWSQQQESLMQIMLELKEMGRKQDKLIQEVGRLQGKAGIQ